MKKFSRIKMLALVSLSSIVLLASVAFAQTTGSNQDNSEKARGEWRGQGRRGGHRGFGKGHMGGGGFRNLNLTDDQKARMKQIRESFGERTKSLRQQLRAKRQELRQAEQGGQLSSDQKTQVKQIVDETRQQLDGLRKESQPRFAAIREQADERLQKVLSAEQWKQFQQERDSMRGRGRRGRNR